MSQESSNSAYGHLNPIFVHNELETSTPISSQHRTDSVAVDPLSRRNTHDKQVNDKTRPRSRSILKNKPSYNESSLTYKGNEIPRETAQDLNSSYYSIANDASRNQALQIQTERAHKVFFSPTKEVVSYGQAPDNGFQVDLINVDRSDKEFGADHDKADDNAKRRGLSFWSRIAVDPRIPYVLSLYLQLFFNIVIVSVVLYILYTVVHTVRQDVRHKVEMYTSDAIQEISLCSRQYFRNRCSNEGASQRAPALEETCMELEKCMNRDPQQIGRSRITAETFADIVNGFLDPISWKSAVMFTGLIVGGVFIINVAFGTYRSRSGLQEFTKSVGAREVEYEDQNENRSSRHLAQSALTTTPPNPSVVQETRRVENDSTISFSSPLSGRSAKQAI